jgi:cytochrome c oxidase subunit 1
MSTTELSATIRPGRRQGVLDLLLTTDHKRTGLLIVATAFVFFLFAGMIALVMRADLAVPGQTLISTHVYNQFFTLHGSAMIYLVVTPFALGMGIYLVPLQIGAPGIAFPRVAQAAYLTFVVSAVAMATGFLTNGGASADGWYAFEPLSSAINSPGVGFNLWIAAVILAAIAEFCWSVCIVWTIVRLRAPGMSMLRMPLFTWSELVTALMGIPAFPALLGAMGIQTWGRIDPGFMQKNLAALDYQNLFWFYGHPVVYIMFFPFVGCVLEVVQTFGGRPYVGYKVTILSLLTFAALSMAVWGHHMFTTGQEANEYYSATSTALSVPAGMEYFGIIGTLYGARLRFKTPMLFAIAFLPQFLVGGLTGVMLASPVLDYDLHGTYFLVGHFHYTLFAGSVFGFFAGFYYWFPKVTGRMLNESLGKAHFWIMVVGTNLTFMPMLALGFLGMPRRVAHYVPPLWHTLNLVESCGAGIIAISVAVLLVNIGETMLGPRSAPADPWDGLTLEWATPSPPPQFNFPGGVPPVKGYAPLWDAKRTRRDELSNGSSPAGLDSQRHPDDVLQTSSELPQVEL